jgi:hypothetical protein
MKLITCWIVLAATIASADDWPQWRGPQADGVWRETDIVDALPDSALAPRWRVPIASGYSGPTVADGRVYVMDRLTKPKQIERIHCFDWQTGESIWSHEYPREYRDVGYTAGPRTSAVVHDGLAYALGTMGDFHVLDACRSGAVGVDAELSQQAWRCCGSPVRGIPGRTPPGPSSSGTSAGCRDMRRGSGQRLTA